MAESVEEKLRNLNNSALLKKKKIEELYYQITDIVNTFRKEVYDKIHREIIALSNKEKDIVKEVLVINRNMIKEKPVSATYLNLFIEAMEFLLGQFYYRQEYSLKRKAVGLFVDLCRLRRGYQEGIKVGNLRMSRRLLNRLEEKYTQFVNIEFGLVKIADFCVVIRDLAIRTINLMRELKSPSIILKERDKWIEQDREFALAKVKEEISKNREFFKVIRDTNGEEIKIIVQLSEELMREGAKTQTVNAKIKQLKSKI